MMRAEDQSSICAGCAPGIPRRRFLGQGLILAIFGFMRRVLGQGSWAPRYRPARSTRLGTPRACFDARETRRFVAQAISPPSAANPNQPIRINGMLVRTAAGDDHPDRFKAVNVLCPHERCDVDFINDPSQLAAQVVAEIGPVKDPSTSAPAITAPSPWGRAKAGRSGPARPLPFPGDQCQQCRRRDWRDRRRRTPLPLSCFWSFNNLEWGTRDSGSPRRRRP